MVHNGGTVFATQGQALFERHFMRPVSLALLVVSLASVSFAAEPPAEPQAEEAEGPRYNFKDGPMTAEPGHNLQVEVPEGYMFLGMPDADRFMKANGSLHNDDLLGVVLPTTDEQGDWAAIIRFEDEGHIDDSEKVDGDELLKAFQENAPEMNKERVAAGFKALQIKGWRQAPHYDLKNHQLVWGLNVLAEGETEFALNYNTRILGRTGYASVNFVTDASRFDDEKKYADALLAGTSFKPGSQYADFNGKTDKVAEYGLTGLVLGGAGLGLAKAAKIGLLAKFGKVILGGLLALKKAIIPLIIGIGALFKKIFGRKTADES